MKKKGEEIVFIEQPKYHNNPVDNKGSLVVTEFGDDLIDICQECSGMTTTAIRIQEEWKGIKAKFIEIFISKKPSQFIERPINLVKILILIYVLKRAEILIGPRRGGH